MQSKLSNKQNVVKSYKFALESCLCLAVLGKIRNFAPSITKNHVRIPRTTGRIFLDALRRGSFSGRGSMLVPAAEAG